MHFFSIKFEFFKSPQSFGAVCLCAATLLGGAFAQPAFAAQPDRVSLAKSFVEKMKSGFERAEEFLSLDVDDEEVLEQLNTLPEGEPLLFQVKLEESGVVIVGSILTEYREGKLLASLYDFIDTLAFPIKIADDGLSAQGWYIKEDQRFTLDMNSREVSTPVGVFSFSDDVAARDGDIFIPLDELGSWFDVEARVNTASLFLTLNSAQELPLEARLNRRKRNIIKNERPPVRFEQVAKEYEIAALPAVDISTNSSFSRNTEREQRNSSTNYNIRTSGDFLKGTLETNLQGNREGGLNSARFNYSKTSLEPELLGGLKARQYEVGDIVGTRLPLTGASAQEIGARVTNRDPLLSTIFPTTQITGDATPGWDVELYRDGSLIDFRAIGDDGFYNFEDVRLFRGENSFKLIFYGLQGQVEERLLEVPVNADQLDGRGGVYDISVTAAESRILDLNDLNANVNNPDENEPHLVARYEVPIGDQSAVGIGIRSRPEDGDRQNYLQGSLSTVVGPTLFNVDVAVNDEADGAVEFTARRGFGDGHEMNSSVFLATDGYTPNSTSEDNVIVRSGTTLTGPLKAFGDKSRYSVFSNYTESTSDVSSFTLGASSTNRIGKTAFNQSLQYRNVSNDSGSTDSITGSTLVSRYVQGNNLRFIADYQVEPERELETLRASVNRVVSSDLDGILEVRRDIEEEFTTGSLGVNWKTPYARISPQVSYDTDGTFAALLTTTTGIVPNRSGGLEFRNRNITGLGGVSAFVFVDDNGNGVFDEGEFPIEEAEVSAVQAGRKGVSDEAGLAFIPDLRENTLTDIVLEPSTLRDPFWIPASESVSIRPRPGYVAKLNFPVLNAGEMDGFVYVNLPDGSIRPLRGVSLKLYDEVGGVEQISTTSADGFYLFSLIRPGKYYLIADGDTLPKSVVPAKPQEIVIGYDGTIIYGNEVHLEVVGDVDDDDVTGVVNIDVLRDLDGYLARHDHVGVELQDADRVILNLGSYKSRLMMAVKWYLLKSRYANIMRDMDSLVPPAESYASAETGEHTLRAAVSGQSFDDAYKRCTALSARGFSCAVEILPGALSGMLEKTAMVSEDKI